MTPAPPLINQRSIRIPSEENAEPTAKTPAKHNGTTANMKENLTFDHAR